MTPQVFRCAAVTLVIGVLVLWSSGCVAPIGGYGYDGGASLGADYYEPYGADYGGWGPGYRVGPVRDGDHRADRGGGHATHAYRSAPASHSIPSIPSGSRSGGGHSGGGHAGGGHSDGGRSH